MPEILPSASPSFAATTYSDLTHKVFADLHNR
jgi:hypothetical protein